jgi:hypothetical protein
MYKLPNDVSHLFNEQNKDMVVYDIGEMFTDVQKNEKLSTLYTTQTFHLSVKTFKYAYYTVVIESEHPGMLFNSTDNTRLDLIAHDIRCIKSTDSSSILLFQLKTLSNQHNLQTECGLEKKSVEHEELTVYEIPAGIALIRWVSVNQHSTLEPKKLNKQCIHGNEIHEVTDEGFIHLSSVNRAFPITGVHLSNAQGKQPRSDKWIGCGIPFINNGISYHPYNIMDDRVHFWSKTGITLKGIGITNEEFSDPNVAWVIYTSSNLMTDYSVITEYPQVITSWDEEISILCKKVANIGMRNIALDNGYVELGLPYATTRGSCGTSPINGIKQNTIKLNSYEFVIQCIFINKPTNQANDY